MPLKLKTAESSVVKGKATKPSDDKTKAASSGTGKSSDKEKETKKKI